MDLVLEGFDTFLFDPIYAALLPIQSAGAAPNATFSGLKEANGAAYPATNGWEYTPSTQYISLTPGQSAYMSSWTRDDWRRQLLTLFLITWYDSTFAIASAPD